MSKAILKYKSHPKAYVINCHGAPYRGAINELRISEDFSINEKLKYILPDLGNYQVIIETEVNDSSELQSKHFEIKKIIEELDRSWMYACGHPLNKKILSFVGPYIDFPDGNMNGWTSNYREAEKEVNIGKVHIVFNAEKVTHSSFSYWPLKNALTVRDAVISTQDNVAALIDLHYFAHKVEDSYSSLFFLAKAMELVRAMLPGKTDDKKEKQLPDEFKSRLKTSLHYIMGLANNRYEIRHIVKEKKNCTLHEKLNNDEIDDYKHDSDLFIRFVACRELAIPLIFPKRM
jgi:hypothetical protein